MEYYPSFFRHYGIMQQRLGVRVMLVAGSMPDAQGNVSLSLYSGTILEECRRVAADPNGLLIVEVSPHYPFVRALAGHDNTLNVREIDYLVETDQRPPVFPNPEPSPEELAIASHAVTFIKDGATLQTGIGAVPNAVAMALVDGDGGDYGVHSEMFTDGLLELIKRGKVTNQRKTINKGVSAITFAAGSQEMYDYINDNPAVGMAPVYYTNDPHVISQNHRMVCINSALEVDLLGQMAAEAIGLRQFSGVGGHQDFVEGTSLHVDHVSLICLESTAMVKGERKSRIASVMTPNSAITSPRQIAGVIVTEFGAADLRAKSVRARAEALAAIAHPDFRDELLAAARQMG
jgi:acyl-CoA hydrolase